MSINGKHDHFLLTDLIAVGESISLPRPGEIIKEIGMLRNVGLCLPDKQDFMKRGYSDRPVSSV